MDKAVGIDSGLDFDEQLNLNKMNQVEIISEKISINISKELDRAFRLGYEEGLRYQIDFDQYIERLKELGIVYPQF